MKKPAKIGLAVILVFWALFFAALLIVAQRPAAAKTPAYGAYTHPEDGYIVTLKKGWEPYEAEEKRLVIVNREEDAAITFTLEAGGFDYLTEAECAKRWIAAAEDVTFDPDSPAAVDSIYPALTFSGMAGTGKTALAEEYYIFHPAEGIRLYALCVHRKDLPGNTKKEAEAIITSVLFPDFTAVYEKYMRLETGSE